MLYWGGGPAKLFLDNGSATTEIVGAVIKAANTTGGTRQISSTANRPDVRTSDGILGAIGWKSIKRNYLNPLTSGNSWKFSHVTVDSDAVNYRLTRQIVADWSGFRRVIVVFSPSYYHAISLVAKRGVVNHFDYGGALRVLRQIAKQAKFAGRDRRYRFIFQ